MQSDVLILFRRTLSVNLCFGVFLTVLTYIFFKSFAFVFMGGLIISQVNFIVNGIITNYLLTKKGEKYAPLYMLSFLFRIASVAVIGFILFTHNKFNVVAYMLGYTTHFIGVLFYSQKSDTKEKGSD